MKIYKDDKNQNAEVPENQLNSSVEGDGAEINIKKVDKLGRDPAENNSTSEASCKNASTFQSILKREKTAFEKSLAKSFMRPRRERDESE